MKKSSMTLNWVKDNNRHHFTTKRNLATLHAFVMGKVLSEGSVLARYPAFTGLCTALYFINQNLHSWCIA